MHRVTHQRVESHLRRHAWLSCVLLVLTACPSESPEAVAPDVADITADLTDTASDLLDSVDVPDEPDLPDAASTFAVSGTVSFDAQLFPPPWGQGELVVRLMGPGGLGGVFAETTVQVDLLAAESVGFTLELDQRPPGGLAVTASYSAPSMADFEAFQGLQPLEASEGDVNTASADVLVDTVLGGTSDHYCGSDPLDRHERACVFEFVWRFISLTSPFLEPKGIDWDSQRTERYESALDAPDDASFYRAMAQLVTTLKDHHTAILGLPLAAEYLACPEASATVFEGKAYLTSGSGLPAGVAVGDEVVALDGATVDERLNEARNLYSDHHQQRFEALASRLFLCGPVGSVASLDVTTAAGPSTIELARNTLLDVSALLSPAELSNAELIQQAVYPTTNGDVAYLRIQTFRHSSVVEAFDEALAGHAAASAIVLDVRGNSGGFIESMHEIVGRFLASELVPYELVNVDGSRADVVIAPSGAAPFTGPVVVLIDELSYSASSLFASAMRARGATLVGRSTGGGSSPLDYDVYPLTTQSFLSTSSNRYYDLESAGPSVDMNGVGPDVLVPLTLEDVLAGVAFDYGVPGDPGVVAALDALAAP